MDMIFRARVVINSIRLALSIATKSPSEANEKQLDKCLGSLEALIISLAKFAAYQKVEIEVMDEAFVSNRLKDAYDLTG